MDISFFGLMYNVIIVKLSVSLMPWASEEFVLNSTSVNSILFLHIMATCPAEVFPGLSFLKLLYPGNLHLCFSCSLVLFRSRMSILFLFIKSITSVFLFVILFALQCSIVKSLLFVVLWCAAILYHARKERLASFVISGTIF